MLTRLERHVATLQKRLVLLAPPHRGVPDTFRNVTIDGSRWAAMMGDMQRLRAGIYKADGAVPPEQLSPGGLHRTPEDERSWHLLILNREQRVRSCVWYMEHDAPQSIDELSVRNCVLATDATWHRSLHNAVKFELDRARRERLRYAEIGGWAVSSESRLTADGLLLALGAYRLGRFLGGALGLTTATVRHRSSTILRRLGGSRLAFDGVTVPIYYDAKYACDMEVLRFDSRTPNPKYDPLIHSMQTRLADVQVVAARGAGPGARQRDIVAA